MKNIAFSIAEKLPNQSRKLISVYLTFFVFFIITIFMDPTILTSYSRLWPLSLQFAPLMLAAMSQASIMLTGGINLGLGASLSLMTAVAAVVVTPGRGPAGVLITIISGMLVGLLMGVVVVFGKLPDIIVTLAFSYIWHGIALTILPVPGGNLDPAYVKLLNGPNFFSVAVLTVAFALLVWKFLKMTKLGLSIYAAGGNSKSAFENGINVKAARISGYVMSGFFISLAGLVLVGQTGSGDPNIGSSYTMNSIAAATLGGVSFLGGVGQMKGVVMGSFIFTALINILFFSGLSPFYQYVVQGIILIVAIGLNAISYYRKGGDRG